MTLRRMRPVIASNRRNTASHDCVPGEGALFVGSKYEIDLRGRPEGLV